MSIKVYCAYRIDAKNMQKFMHDCQKKSAELLARFIISNVNRVDAKKMREHYYHIGKEEFTERCKDKRQELIYKIFFIVDALEETSSGLSGWKLENEPLGYWPLSVKLNFYPSKDGKFYAFGIFRGDLDGLDDWIKEYPGVSDYSYWNNTDPDETVSKREWNKRGDFWDEALDYHPLCMEIVNWNAYHAPTVAIQKVLGIGFFKPNGKLEEFAKDILRIDLLEESTQEEENVGTGN